MLLQKHGLMRFSGLFTQYELTIDELQHWPLPSLLELLKAPAGPTRRFLEEVQNMSEAERAMRREAAEVDARGEHGGAAEGGVSPAAACPEVRGSRLAAAASPETATPTAAPSEAQQSLKAEAAGAKAASAKKRSAKTEESYIRLGAYAIC